MIMSHRSNPLRERNSDDKGRLREARDYVFGKGGLSYPVALQRAKRSKALSGYDEETIEKSVAVWQAKMLAATYIRRARVHANMTQSELGEALRVPANYITMAEGFGNDMKVPLDLLVRVSHVTGLPLVLGSSGDKEQVDRKALAEVMERIRKRP